ncbi:MAG: aspartate--ammonia ligase [Sphaerochaetaceae bacterium]|jgi:aspartate--ammonia ligase
MGLLFPTDYKPLMTTRHTEKAIKFVKDTFESELSAGLYLSRVTSPLFVASGSGVNDDLNGIDQPVSFHIKQMNNNKVEIVQSLAKWKRMALADHGYQPNSGLYTDMNAIRPDDELDATHSIYVDQWDWELVMEEGNRNLDYLKFVVNKIYRALKRTEFLVGELFPMCTPSLAEQVTFIHAEDAQKEYPDLTADEREQVLTQKYGTIFLLGIGWPLADGKPHGSRAPDYDDWSTPLDNGYRGLNGDLIIWDSVRSKAMELSSMGIRVDKPTLLRQLEHSNTLERKELYWHKRLLHGDFPQTIGGGIGQSRMCMLLLKKAHIGEVQASVWPSHFYEEAKKHKVQLL